MWSRSSAPRREGRSRCRRLHWCGGRDDSWNADRGHRLAWQKTTHHFYLYEDGGAIQVTLKDASDTTDLDAIRMHLPHIAMMFGQGDFTNPMLVHDRSDVPGAADMARLKDRIAYHYHEIPDGGRVDIVTTDPAALNAVHAFLAFQISDHQTGDPLAVSVRRPDL